MKPQHFLAAVLAVGFTVAGASAFVTDNNAAPNTTKPEKTGDWSLWGGELGRNMVSDTKDVSLDFGIRLAVMINEMGPLALSDRATQKSLDCSKEQKKKLKEIFKPYKDAKRKGELSEDDINKFKEQVGKPAVAVLTEAQVARWKSAKDRFLWGVTLGSQTYGNPVVHKGKVIVGTNNGGGYRAEKHPADQDKGVLLCFEEATGKFLWQLTREKTPNRTR